MKIVKGDSNGYPVPGGIAGPPIPWGYKYGGLALQDGGWATGQEPLTIKLLTFRKSKLWPWNRLSGIDLGSRKRVMRIVTWNVRILYGAGAMNELVKEMDKYTIDICALQEIRWPEKGNLIKRIT
jgi:hypothetical protein